MCLASLSTPSRSPNCLLKSSSPVHNLSLSMSGLNLSRITFFKSEYDCTCSPDRTSNMAHTWPHRRVGSLRIFFSFYLLLAAQTLSSINQGLMCHLQGVQGELIWCPMPSFPDFSINAISKERLSFDRSKNNQDMCIHTRCFLCPRSLELYMYAALQS